MLWLTQFQREQEKTDLHTVHASINEVAKEEVSDFLAWLACLLYHVQKVVKLAMDVTHDT